jgi:hypothetical protein
VAIAPFLPENENCFSARLSTPLREKKLLIV